MRAEYCTSPSFIEHFTEAARELGDVVAELLKKYPPEAVFQAVNVIWTQTLITQMSYLTLEMLRAYLLPLTLCLGNLGIQLVAYVEPPEEEVM